MILPEPTEYIYLALIFIQFTFVLQVVPRFGLCCLRTMSYICLHFNVVSLIIKRACLVMCMHVGLCMFDWVQLLVLFLFICCIFLYYSTLHMFAMLMSLL